MSTIRLVAFDLDGTLLRGETVDETLARHVGHLDRCLEHRRARSREEMIANREERAAWYAPVPVDELHRSLAAAELAPGVREAFGLLEHHGVHIAIVSITWEFAVAWFAQLLGADSYVGTGIGRDGRLSHFWSEDKAPWLERLGQRLGIGTSETAAVGDSEGDLEMLDTAGMGFFVGDEKPASDGPIHVPGADIHDIAKQIVEQ